MAAQERRVDAGEFDRRFARNVARDTRFKGVRVQPGAPGARLGGRSASRPDGSWLMLLPVPLLQLSGSKSGRDEEEDVDMKLLEERDARLTERRRQEAETERAQRSSRRMNTITQSCAGCMRDNPNFKRHLVIALGEYTYLKVMERPLVPGHCIIAPVEVWRAGPLAALRAAHHAPGRRTDPLRLPRSTSRPWPSAATRCGPRSPASVARSRPCSRRRCVVGSGQWAAVRCVSPPSPVAGAQDEGTVYLETASDLGFRRHAYMEVRRGGERPQPVAWPPRVVPRAHIAPRGGAHLLR